MTEAVKPKMARKVRRVVDVRVEADVEGLLGRYYFGGNDPERRAKDLENAVSEFNTFIRDHRSMDRVRLSVERVVADLCEACGSEWETDTDEGGDTVCASCGRVEVK